jgi:hypothetical protein
VTDDLQQSSARWCRISCVGTTFWIFVGIALLQAVVGGLAKMAEKRKKAEAASKLSGASAESGARSPRDARRAVAAANNQERSGARPVVENAPKTSRDETASVASERLEELRRTRIEVLRQRMGITPTAGTTSLTSASTSPTPSGVPPIVVSVPTQAARTVAAPPQRRSTKPSESPSRSRAEPRRAVSDRGAVSDRVSRSMTPKGGSKLKSAAKSIVPNRDSSGGRSNKRHVGSAGRTAASLAGQLRNRGSFQRAVLMSELLQPPVGLRPSTSDGRQV